MSDVHECETCGQMCDCDGDDLDQAEPAEHCCINPECGKDDGEWNGIDERKDAP